jgi:hypothetical protein
MNNAPATAAALPAPVIAPDVPASAGRPVVIMRGGALLSTPISVAHVSAVAAASAPVQAENRAAARWASVCGYARASSAATPPLAST